jgi:flagellar motor switch protein FliM
MTEVLSQNEIDQLLAAINANDSEQITAGGRKIKIYNFKCPHKFTREQIMAISLVHDTFARLTTTSLSAHLRSMVHVHVASVDQLSYEEFIRSIPTPTTLAILSMTPLKGNAILEIAPDVTSAIIDRICGGSGEVEKYRHELTDIETSIMENVIVSMLGNIREGWDGIMDLQPRLGQIDTNPQFAQIVPPTEMVVLVELEAKVGDVEGIINICIPYSTIEPIIGKLSIWHKEGQNNTLLRFSTNLELISREDVPVRLTAEVLRRDYPIKEILNWDIGTIILPFHSLKPGYCYLRLGDRRVWQCQILPDCKGLPKRITVVNYAEKPFGTEGNYMEMDKANPLVRDALFSAMMKVSVELGCTFKTVKEVFSMGEGTIVELDKLAGEAVDIIANGVRIAKGEVVVIDENFGVRITEIIGTPDASGQSGQDEPQQPAPEPPEPTKPRETAAEQNAAPNNVSVEQGFPIGTKENPADLETVEGENAFVNWLKRN